MMNALVGGKLHAKPEARTGKNGNTFATAKVRAAAGDGESLFVNVIAFDHAAVTALLALDRASSALPGMPRPCACDKRMPFGITPSSTMARFLSDRNSGMTLGPSPLPYCALSANALACSGDGVRYTALPTRPGSEMPAFFRSKVSTSLLVPW
jgi:hypothetical protein